MVFKSDRRVNRTSSVRTNTDANTDTPGERVMSREDISVLISKLGRFYFRGDTDDLYFLHIPKTAGSALTEILRFLKMCPTPGGRGQPIKPDGLPDFDHPITGMEKECCCIHTCIGHELYGHIETVREKLVPEEKKLFSVTILREPVSRTTSEYWYVEEIVKKGLKPQFVPRKIYPELVDGSMTLEKFITAPNSTMATKCCGLVNNRQVVMLAGIEDHATFVSLGDKKVFELAWDHLMSLDYFGMADQWQESVELLLWTFGQDNRTFVPSSATWNRVHPHPKPTPEQTEMILQANKLDSDLVNSARIVFNERIKIMRADKARNPE